MEALVSAGVEDNLISSLDFSHAGVARYLLSSRHCIFPAESGNRFDSTSSRLLRFRIADTSTLECASCRVAFSLVNDTVNNAVPPVPIVLTPIAPASAIFKRARVFIGGQLAEDITDLGRVVCMYDKLKPNARRSNDSIQGFALKDDGAYEDVPASASKRCIVDLPLGLLSQGKWLPMSLVSGGGVSIELELDDAVSCFSTAAAKWHLEECQLYCTMHEVDAGMLNGLTDVFLGGNPIHIPYDGIACSRHLITSSSFTINIARSFTRLKSCLVTLYRAGVGKPVNALFHPVQDQAVSNATDDLSYQCQIASHKYPERHCKGLSEAFMRLRQTAACFYGNDDVGITPQEFRKDSFIACMEFERAGAQAFHTGISTRNGQILTISFENSGLGAAGDFAVVTLCYDAFAKLSQSGVEILE